MRLIGSVSGMDPGAGYNTVKWEFDYRANGYVHSDYTTDAVTVERTTDAYNDSISESDSFKRVIMYHETTTNYIGMRVNNNVSNYNTHSTAGDRLDFKNMTLTVLDGNLMMLYTNGVGYDIGQTQAAW